MSKKVTSKQVTYAAAAIIMTTSLLTKQLYIFMKNEAWIAVLAGAVMSFLILLIYASLAKKFQTAALNEINDAVFGPFLGKVISVFYIYFFFTIACLNTNLAGSFVKEFVLPTTPTIYILVLFMLICIWAVRKGPVNLMKYSVLITFISIVVMLLNVLLLYKLIDLKNLLPMFNQSITDYIVGTHTITIIPLCDPFVMLMFLPDMYKPNELGKALSKGLILGALFLLLVVFRDTTVLGQALAIVNFPTLTSIRQIDVGDIITRMDIIYISTLIILMFYKVSIFFYATLTGIQRLLKFESGQFLINIIGVLIILYAIIIFPASYEHFNWLVNGSASIFNTFFVVGLPLLTMVVAACRGYYKQPKTA